MKAAASGASPEERRAGTRPGLCWASRWRPRTRCSRGLVTAPGTQSHTSHSAWNTLSHRSQRLEHRVTSLTAPGTQSHTGHSAWNTGLRRSQRLEHRVTSLTVTGAHRSQRLEHMVTPVTAPGTQSHTGHSAWNTESQRLEHTARQMFDVVREN